ncbi:BTAD domain-containing putative transcriptional regulator [Nonomuraea sp. KM90]|uniref:BTAD domain-containing putative transcriptional regulator n=1 Tax=Nonomuraea sp. KM90 TaxID=3457428 RepID=UPI003FCC51B4
MRDGGRGSACGGTRAWRWGTEVGDGGGGARATSGGARTAAGGARTAAATLREALALWCGHALAGPGWHERGAADVAKLDSLRPAATEHGTGAGQGLGRHAGTVGGSLPVRRQIAFRVRALSWACDVKWPAT